MRIEAYNQVHQLYQTKKVNKVREKSGVAQTDQLQFSNFGREIGAAQAALAGTPDQGRFGRSDQNKGPERHLSCGYGIFRPEAYAESSRAGCDL